MTTPSAEPSPWPLLPLPHAALGAAALRAFGDQLLALAAEAEDEDGEAVLLHENTVAEKLLSAIRPEAPFDLADPDTGGVPARFPLSDGGAALRRAGGGLVISDGAGAPRATLTGADAASRTAALGWRAPGLAAQVTAAAQGRVTVQQAIVGYSPREIARLPMAPGRALQALELRAPGGWPRALLLHELSAADAQLPPVLLQGAEALDQLSRFARAGVHSDAPACAAEPLRVEAELRWGLLSGALPGALASEAEAQALFVAGGGAPTAGALRAHLDAMGASGRPHPPEGAQLRLELRQTGRLAEGPNDGLFAEAWSALDPDLQPGTWLAAWAWADPRGTLRVRYDGLFCTDAGWRWLPKPWRASPRA